MKTSGEFDSERERERFLRAASGHGETHAPSHAKLQPCYDKDKNWVTGATFAGVDREEEKE